jgi:hypothetical protein
MSMSTQDKRSNFDIKCKGGMVFMCIKVLKINVKHEVITLVGYVKYSWQSKRKYV